MFCWMSPLSQKKKTSIFSWLSWAMENGVSSGGQVLSSSEWGKLLEKVQITSHQFISYHTKLFHTYELYTAWYTVIIQCISIHLIFDLWSAESQEPLETMAACRSTAVSTAPSDRSQTPGLTGQAVFIILTSMDFSWFLILPQSLIFFPAPELTILVQGALIC